MNTFKFPGVYDFVAPDPLRHIRKILTTNGREIRSPLGLYYKHQLNKGDLMIAEPWAPGFQENAFVREADDVIGVAGANPESRVWAPRSTFEELGACIADDLVLLDGVEYHRCYPNSVAAPLQICRDPKVLLTLLVLAKERHLVSAKPIGFKLLDLNGECIFAGWGSNPYEQIYRVFSQNGMEERWQQRVYYRQMLREGRFFKIEQVSEPIHPAEQKPKFPWVRAHGVDRLAGEAVLLRFYAQRATVPVILRGRSEIESLLRPVSSKRMMLTKEGFPLFSGEKVQGPDGLPPMDGVVVKSTLRGVPVYTSAKSMKEFVATFY